MRESPRLRLEFDELWETLYGESQANPQRSVGVVKWFSYNRGYGFIIDEQGKEIFVHYKSIRGTGSRSLKDNQRVSFLMGSNDEGIAAIDVVVIQDN